MKKSIAIVICVLILVSFALVACNNSTENDPEVVTPVLEMEDDLTVDYESSIGLYFFGENGDDFKRSIDAKDDINYFDPSKPTVIFFHGWKPTALDEDEIATDFNISGSVFETSPSGITTRNSIASYKNAGYNIAGMDWSSYADELALMFEQIWVSFDNSHSIACRFAKEYINFFSDYNQDIIFTGHSFGAHSSIATAYLLYKYAEYGTITEDKLPKRLTIADPYIGDLLMVANDDACFKNIDNLGDALNGRYPADMFADAMEYLNGKEVAIDIYCGMPFAYDQIYTIPSNTYKKDVLSTRRAACLKKLQDNGVWTVMRGLQYEYGTIGTDVHVYTLEWMVISTFNDVKVNPNGGYYPTAALSNEEIRKLYGRKFKVVSLGFDVANAKYEEYDAWPEYVDWEDFSDVEAAND